MTNSDDFDNNPPNILLPYQEWIESAYRQVTRNALKYAAKHGLPGNHSFYLTFNTSYPGVSIPSRLKTQYPNEMTIVLQHQFWDLIIDEQEKKLSIGLSFSGVTSTLTIPFGAFTAFSDPEAKLLLTYSIIPPSVSAIQNHPISKEDQKDTPLTATKNKEDTQVINLDAFRKKHD